MVQSRFGDLLREARAVPAPIAETGTESVNGRACDAEPFLQHRPHRPFADGGTIEACEYIALLFSR